MIMRSNSDVQQTAVLNTSTSNRNTNLDDIIHRIDPLSARRSAANTGIAQLTLSLRVLTR